MLQNVMNQLPPQELHHQNKHRETHGQEQDISSNEVSLNIPV